MFLGTSVRLNLEVPPLTKKLFLSPFAHTSEWHYTTSNMKRIIQAIGLAIKWKIKPRQYSKKGLKLHFFKCIPTKCKFEKLKLATLFSQLVCSLSDIFPQNMGFVYIANLLRPLKAVCLILSIISVGDLLSASGGFLTTSQLHKEIGQIQTRPWPMDSSMVCKKGFICSLLTMCGI